MYSLLSCGGFQSKTDRYLSRVLYGGGFEIWFLRVLGNLIKEIGNGSEGSLEHKLVHYY